MNVVPAAGVLFNYCCCGRNYHSLLLFCRHRCLLWSLSPAPPSNASGRRAGGVTRETRASATFPSCHCLGVTVPAAATPRPADRNPDNILSPERLAILRRRRGVLAPPSACGPTVSPLSLRGSFLSRLANCMRNQRNVFFERTDEKNRNKDDNSSKKGTV